MDVDDDATAPDLPAPLLPVLSLPEAHDLLGVLADVAAGRRPDAVLARSLLMNLAARVPSREESLLDAVEAELLEAAASFGPRQMSDAVYTAFYELSRTVSAGNATTLRNARARVTRINGARIRLPEGVASRRLRAALKAYASAWADAGASTSRG